jgi:GTPase SAR1 family protein
MPQLTELKESNRITCLVYGDSGCGKTIFATTFPSPIYVADFDGKISSAARFHSPDTVRGISFDDYSLGHRDEKGNLIDTFKLFESKLKEIELLRDKIPYKTVVLDSLTTFSDAMLKNVTTIQAIKPMFVDIKFFYI